MDSFWLNIDHNQFEELAYHYACWKEPSWDWKPTKATRDGGRDGEARIIDETTQFGEIEKYAWYEAKHTKHYKYALPLSKIASTVLIGSNKKDFLEKIIIITNAKFSTTTINEIKFALGNKVEFVFGDELTTWLKKNSQKQIRKDFGIDDDIEDKETQMKLVDSPIIVESSALYNSVFSESSYLLQGRQYNLVFVLYIPPDKYQNLEFKVNYEQSFIKIEEDEFPLQSGNNYINISFTTTRLGQYTEPTFLTIHEQNTDEIVRIKINGIVNVTSDSDVFVNIQTQHQSLFNITAAYNEVLHNEGTHILLIKGDAGCGKSYVLEKFISNYCEHSEFIYLKFKREKNIENSFLLIRLIVFIVFGRFFSNNNIEPEDVEKIEHINEFNRLYVKYLNFLNDESNLFENANGLINSKFSIVPFTNSKQKKIIVLDDLQFLSEKSSELLLRILSDLSESNHNVFLLSAKRNVSLSHKLLDDFFEIYSARKPQRILISKNDILTEIEQYDCNNLPDHIIKKIKRNVFVYRDFISFLSKNNDIIDVINSENVKNILKGDDIISFGYNELSKKEKEVTDIVYFNNNGVDCKFIVDNYSEAVINKLIQKDVILFDHIRNIFIPFHDIYLDSLNKIINYDSDHVYKYAIYQKDKGNILAYLSTIGIFHFKLIQNLNFLISKVTEYHTSQKYFNVHYVLKRLFLNDKIDDIISPFNKALLMYYYAYSTFNVGESNGLNLYKKAKDGLKYDKTDSAKSLSKLILSEIINCQYWELDFNNIKEGYNEIKTYFFSLKVKGKDDWQAYLTASNRYININIFLDETEEAKSIYHKVLEICNEDFDIRTWSIRLNFSFLNIENSPEQSYNNLLYLFQNCDSLPLKTKFIIKTHYFKVGNILNKCDIRKLEKVIEWGEENNLNYNFKVAKLQLAICYALKHEIKLVEETISCVIDIRDFPALAKGIYHNLKSLVHLSNQDYVNAIDCINKQKDNFKGFGQSYFNKIDANQELVSQAVTEFDIKYEYKTYLKSTFFVECRF